MQVSILIPLFNCAQYLKASLSSILSQTHKDIEVVIIDNGSTDDPLSIINSFKDSRIKYYNIERKSLANTLNYGIEKCSNEIVARMDADDLMSKTRIEKQLKIFKEHRENLILSSQYSIFQNDKILYNIKSSTEDKSIRKRLALHSEIIHSGAMYNKSFVVSNGGYNTNVRIEDYELWLRLNSKAYFLNVPEILSFVRYRPDSISWSNLKNKNKDIYNYQEKYYTDESLKDLGYKSETEREIIKGWREYFYGNKNTARRSWRLKALLKNPKLILAFITTLLSDALLIKFTEFRLKFRLKYIFYYFASENIKLRKEFKQLINT